MKHKKVLLRERKRHTIRCVASTPYVVLTGYPPPPSGYPPQPGYPPGQGTPPPQLDLAGYPPRAGPGRVPPPPGCPMAFWEMLQSIMGYGYPPSPCGQTNKVKLLPSRRTTYAGGNKNDGTWRQGFIVNSCIFYHCNVWRIQRKLSKNPCRQVPSIHDTYGHKRAKYCTFRGHKRCPRYLFSAIEIRIQDFSKKGCQPQRRPPIVSTF